MRAARWALGLAAAGSLLAVSPRLASAYALPKLLALAAGVAAAWAVIVVKGAPSRSTPLDRPLLALGAALLASLAVSQDPFLSVVGHYRMYALGLLPLSLCAAVFFAAVRSAQSEEPAPLLRLCALAGLLMGAHALLQYGGVEPLAGMPGKLPQGRAVGALGSPVYLGACLAGLFPLALGLLLDGKGRDRLLGGAGALAAALGLLCTVSRGAWLAAAAGTAVLLVLSGRLRPPRSRRVLAGAAALALVLGVALSTSLRRSARGDSARVELWLSALEAWRRHPWLGSGPDTFEAQLRRHRTDGFIRALGPNAGQADAHNDLLQALATTGLAGLAAYLWLVWAAAAMAWRARGEAARGGRAAAAAALAALFLQAKFNPMPLPALVLAALCAALLCPAAGPSPAPRRAWADGGVLLFCAAALVLIGRLAAADRAQRAAQVLFGKGRFEQALAAFDRAERLNPAEVQYRLVHVQRLYALAGAEAEPSRRLALLERAVRSGRAAVAWRPNDVDARQILGASLFSSQRAGGPDRLSEAEAQLDSALALDSRFTPLLENRLKLALARGDKGRAEALAAELKRLDMLK